MIISSKRREIYVGGWLNEDDRTSKVVMKETGKLSNEEHIVVKNINEKCNL